MTASTRRSLSTSARSLGLRSTFANHVLPATPKTSVTGHSRPCCVAAPPDPGSGVAGSAAAPTHGVVRPRVAAGGWLRRAPRPAGCCRRPAAPRAPANPPLSTRPALAMALVFSGFETTTRPTCWRIGSATGHVFTVASSTTWSSARKLPQAFSADGVVSIRSLLTSRPPSSTDSCVKCCGRQAQSFARARLPWSVAETRWATRHLRIRAQSATGLVAGAAKSIHGLVVHHQNGLPLLVFP